MIKGGPDLNKEGTSFYNGKIRVLSVSLLIYHQAHTKQLLI